MSEKKKPEYKLWFHKFMIYFALWAFGELAVCYALGLPMVYGLRKLPKGVVED